MLLLQAGLWIINGGLIAYCGATQCQDRPWPILAVMMIRLLLGKLFAIVTMSVRAEHEGFLFRELLEYYFGVWYGYYLFSSSQAISLHAYPAASAPIGGPLVAHLLSAHLQVLNSAPQERFGGSDWQ